MISLTLIKTAFLGLAAAANMSARLPEGMLGVVNKADGTASLINVETGEARVFKVGHLPHEIALSPGYAFVSNYGSAHIRSTDPRNQPGNTISVISLSDGSVTEVSLGPARCAPHGLVPSADGRRLYVTCEGRNEIAVVDVEQGKLSHFLPTNQAGSHLIVISSDESRAYVSNFWHGTVSVIDLKTRSLIKQINTGRGCEGIGISTDDKSVYVTRVEENEVLKIDTSSLEIVQRRTLPPGSSPIRVNSVPNNSQQIVVNNVGSGTMQILSADDLSLLQEIKVGRQPIGLAVSNEDHAFAANMKDNNVSVINLKTGKIDATFSTGGAPDGIAYLATRP